MKQIKQIKLSVRLDSSWHRCDNIDRANRQASTWCVLIVISFSVRTQHWPACKIDFVSFNRFICKGFKSYLSLFMQILIAWNSLCLYKVHLFQCQQMQLVWLHSFANVYLHFYDLIHRCWWHSWKKWIIWRLKVVIKAYSIIFVMINMLSKISITLILVFHWTTFQWRFIT